ncbi:heavy metal sensor histidine kinase [Methylophaga sp.]|uniref:heavy metal sensor histidine kinase n=1 Tax=Methylophaga sp. TaxID=2024840 RepID=UPI0014001F4A|nr:heavy metal sensor histidine kinase [Methylophaga sp.]MTI64815.1 heavy metal sensor histidine kinase [Methylophaga sp.]
MQLPGTKFKSLSLAARQTLLFALIMLIVISGLGVFVETAIRHHFRVGDNAELQAIIERVEMTLNQGGNNLIQRFEDILIGHHHPLLLVTEPGGTPVYLSDPSAAGLLRWRANVDEQPVTLETADKQHYRLRYQTFTTSTGQQFHITAAIAIDYHLSFLRQFNQSLWLILLAAIVMSTVLGWLAIRYSLRPLSAIVAKIRALSVSQLNNPLDTNQVPQELAQLSESLNAMMRRIDEAFQRLADYSSDIAHELRTPVTALMTQTQVALTASRNPEEYREVLYSSMEELQRMSQMIADMLFLAQTDNTQQLPDIETIHLGKEIKSLLEFYNLLAEDKQITLSCQGEARLSANRLMLRRAIGNLLTNAIRHTAEGGWVQLAIESQPSGVCIHVTNPGEPITQADREKLFDRFYRSRGTENKGTGLGLALVKSIVQAHGGQIMLESDSQQTRFTLFFPQ